MFTIHTLARSIIKNSPGMEGSAYYRRGAVRCAATVLKKNPTGRRVVTELAEGEFWADTNSWGPYIDGRVVYTGVQAGAGGARLVETIGPRAQSVFSWDGVTIPAIKVNGVVSPR